VRDVRASLTPQLSAVFRDVERRDAERSLATDILRRRQSKGVGRPSHGRQRKAIVDGIAVSKKRRTRCAQPRATHHRAV